MSMAQICAALLLCLFAQLPSTHAQQPSSLLDQLAAAELRATQALEEAAALRQAVERQQQRPPPQQRDGGDDEARMDARVQSLIDQMTVTEKARQLDIWRTADILTNGKIDVVKALKQWHPISAGVGVLHDVYAYPQLGNEMMAFILNSSRLKIPPLFGGEATHGLQMDDHTIFPSPISLAATWDTKLMRRYGHAVGSEARAAGTHVTWAPVLGLCREPRWGRCEEMMGEDTHLAAELGRAAITGFTNGKQFNSSSAVAPLMKHYVAYSAPEGGHNTAPAHVGRREVLTTFIPPFSAGMEAGAQALMVSYNEIDGEPNAQSKYLLTSIPRDQVDGCASRRNKTNTRLFLAAQFVLWKPIVCQDRLGTSIRENRTGKRLFLCAGTVPPVRRGVASSRRTLAQSTNSSAATRSCPTFPWQFHSE